MEMNYDNHTDVFRHYVVSSVMKFLLSVMQLENIAAECLTNESRDANFMAKGKIS